MLACSNRRQKNYLIEDDKYFEYIRALLDHQEEVERRQIQLRKIYQSVSLQNKFKCFHFG